MVKFFGLVLLTFVGLAIGTRFYYISKDDSIGCKVKVLTSGSFYNGVGEILKEEYLKHSECILQFDVVNGANLISNLYLKQPVRYDVMMGLDIFQIKKLSSRKVFNFDLTKYPNHKNFIPYDESPITFFVKGIDKTEFKTLYDFLSYMIEKKMIVAVPLNTTSVLGALFDTWLAERDNLLLQRLSADNNIKFVKSWSESLGLFERDIVNGFLSFETSAIYFESDPNIKKISIDAGHPNLKEFMSFSIKSDLADDDKIKFIDFIMSADIQNLLLQRNYMWPVVPVNNSDLRFRTLKVINLE